MDVRSRGTLSTSAGLLFATLGFTLSVLSTILRFIWPFSRAPAPAVVDASAIRRQSLQLRRQSKLAHRRRSAVPSTLTNLSIATPESSSSSEDSSPPRKVVQRTSSTRRARSRSLERSIHNRNTSERLGRSDLRPSQLATRKRSESTPPTPTPRQWTFSKEETLAPPPAAPSLSRRSSLHLSRTPSMDVSHNNGHAHGLSFLHLPKLHRASSSISSIEKRGSLILAPLLHKRKSLDTRRFSLDAGEEDPTSGSSPDSADQTTPRQSIDSVYHVPLPKRSQTLRTRPYEAPYFFPTPGSVQAEEYAAAAAPRLRPARSGTLAPRPVSSIH